MAKTDYKSIDEYHNEFEGTVVERMQKIRNLVHEIAPQVVEVISYQIPAFKLGSKYYLIYYCALKKHLSILSPWTETMLKAFASELKDFKVSKSAIQFPHDKPLPLPLIKRILQFRNQENEQSAKSKK